MYPSAASLLATTTLLALASGAPVTTRAGATPQCGTTKAATALDLVFSNGQQFDSQKGVTDFCNFLGTQNATPGGGPFQVNTTVSTPQSNMGDAVLLAMQYVPTKGATAACFAASSCQLIMQPMFTGCVSNFTSGAFIGTTIATGAVTDDAGCGRFQYNITRSQEQTVV